MSVGRASLNQQEVTQEPPKSYSNDIGWITTSQLPPDDALLDSMFPPNVSDGDGEVNVVLTIDTWKDQFNNYLNTYPHDFHFPDMRGSGRGSGISTALAIGSNLFPTPLPATNDAILPLEWWGSEFQRGEANLHATWAGEEEVDLLEEPSDAQAESPLPTSNSGSSESPQVAPRRQRKREEGGSCDLCNRWFSRRSDVRRHKNTAHAQEVHACPQCQIICSRRDALQRHLRDQH